MSFCVFVLTEWQGFFEEKNLSYPTWIDTISDIQGYFPSV